MKNTILIVLSLFFASTTNAGSHGPCKISQISQTDGAPNYMMVTLACNGTNLPTSCTNLVTNRVGYDATTDVGKFRTSMLLSAFVSGKDVKISSYGICPAELSDTPLVYGIEIY